MKEKKKLHFPDWVSSLAWALGISIVFNVQMLRMEREMWNEMNHQAEVIEIMSEQFTEHLKQDLQFHKNELAFWLDYYRHH